MPHENNPSPAATDARGPQEEGPYNTDSFEADWKAAGYESLLGPVDDRARFIAGETCKRMNAAHAAGRAEQAERVRELEVALQDIVNPMGRIEREVAAKGDDYTINYAAAAHLCQSASYLQDIARAALRQEPK